MCVPLHFVHHTPPPSLSSLPLHDALPISWPPGRPPWQSWPRWSALSLRLAAALVAQLQAPAVGVAQQGVLAAGGGDRKSTRLNSSHLGISYGVFCLKKKIFKTVRMMLMNV